MDFSIEEVKKPDFRIRFYPRYKSGWFWRYIGNHSGFTNSRFAKSNIKSTNFVFGYNIAENIIDEFKEYLKEQESYTKIHKI